MSVALRALHSRLELLSATLLSNGRFVDVGAAMTLLLLLLYSGGPWYFRLPVTVLSLAGIIFRQLRRSAGLWFVLAGLVLAGTLQQWHQADNHKYLMGYWCLAISAALMVEHSERTLALSGRLLIGFSFLFASLWKLISDDYLDGSFFQYTLLIDGRFQGFAERLGGVTRELSEINHAAQRALVNYDSSLTDVRLVYPPVLPMLAGVITWWSLLIELAIAIVFLSPERSRLSRPKDALLLVFILSTYLVAPVTGFGWLLAIMGVAQSSERRAVVGLAYVASALLLQIYRAPWQTLFGVIGA